MAEVMFKMVDENRIHLEPWFSWSKQTQRTEDSLKYLFDKEEKTIQGEQIEYGLFLNSVYIGNISIFDIHKENKSAEIGYWLSSVNTKKGYMSEAVKILEKEAFENLCLNRIQIKCDAENIASIGVAKKCGFTYEGTLMEDTFSNYFNGFRNTMVFSKLKSTYRQALD